MWSPLAILISVLVLVDAFLVSYAVGLNSRSVLVIDPMLPVHKAPTPIQPVSPTTNTPPTGLLFEKKDVPPAPAQSSSPPPSSVPVPTAPTNNIAAPTSATSGTVPTDAPAVPTATPSTTATNTTTTTSSSY